MKTLGIRRITIFLIAEIKQAELWLRFDKFFPLLSCLFAQAAKRLVVSPRLTCLKQIKRASGYGLTLVEVGEVRRTDGSLFADVKVHERGLDRLLIERDRIFEAPAKFRRLGEP